MADLLQCGPVPRVVTYLHQVSQHEEPDSAPGARLHVVAVKTQFIVTRMTGADEAITG